ncbi:long-chain fatty acid--CoA ligase [Roseivirga sp. BDSF3-8]|uniref:long-chain-fatty-acid--CoA ligase n=1 Tax=Roseivirga sp. BDSF3-8 TaxID=3241598 RepID=UPI0035326B45
MLNLAILLEESAVRYADKEAIVFQGRPLTFAQLNGAANQVAAGLRQAGIRQGDKVALSCANLPYFPMAYYGILKAGATVVPLNILLKPDEIAYHLQDSEAKAYFCFQGTEQLPLGQMGYAAFSQVDSCEHFITITVDPAAESPYEGSKTMGQLMHNQQPVDDTVQTRPEDTAVILYTSGTTGKPKGAELTHFNMFYNARASVDLFGFTSEDRQLIVLPLFHSFGQTVQMNAGILAGATTYLQPRFDPQAVFTSLKEDAISVFAGVPTMYWAMLNFKEGEQYTNDIRKSLRLSVAGGSSLPLKVLEDFEARYGVPILEGYGLSECSPVVSFNHLDRERKPGSIGTPIWGVQMMVADEQGQPVANGEKGELLVRGHNVMKGYFNKPEANDSALRNDWLHTGDVATRDDDGYYYIVDRTKDMIIRGGFNVYPREVEEQMMQHPAVSMVAVIGVPDDENGEEVKAYVVLKEGQQVSNEELKAWCKEKMAAYKYPRHIEFRDALPMTATGKILKKELKAEMATA